MMNRVLFFVLLSISVGGIWSQRLGSALRSFGSISDKFPFLSVDNLLLKNFINN